MAKLQRNFVRGRMNKDLDERLVPNGEYRDAQNIQVTTSEGSDVGAIENILGNTKKNLKSTGPDVFWDNGFALTNPTCIGVVRDTSNEKIYWFLTSTTTDAILEYDAITGLVAPILVDRLNVLNFSEDYLITGINILDGMLFWTDDLNEPRKINIATFKAGSTQPGTRLDTHTQVYGRNFIASDITVIKLKPNSAPGYVATASIRGGNGTGISPVQTIKNFASADSEPLAAGTSVNITIEGAVIPNWQIGDIIVLNTSRITTANVKEKYQVRLEITAGAGTSSLDADILSVPQDIPFANFTWECLLVEDKPMFELNFPRFAYRWKYSENEYSAFSPWTEAVFLPNKYNYDSLIGHNTGMINNLRKLTLNSFETPPADVTSVEILYKDSSANIVYKVDDIAPAVTTFNITSELIYNVISDEQSIRPFDNVPIKAKAQEIISNRIVYGNYVQNYNITDEADITASVASTAISTVLSPEESIKALRTYQIGIVYIDENGRETPVFTNSTATVKVPKESAEKVNTLRASSAQTAPSWATGFKYYVKDISNEYYNLALDRYYAAEDGNIWLSFPSAERNKVQLEDYLVLKKSHNSDKAVTEEARYKILDISNEAPSFISTERKRIGAATASSATLPYPNGTFMNFTATDSAVVNDFLLSLGEGEYVRFQNVSTQEFTEYYDLKSARLGSGTNNYILELDRSLSEEDNAIITGVNFIVVVYKIEDLKLAEFLGKFFVKINRDSIIDDNIIYNFTNNPDHYDTIQEQDVTAVSIDDPATPDPPSVPPAERWTWQEYPGMQAPEIFTPISGNTTFGLGFIRYIASRIDDIDNPNSGGDGFVDNIQVGSAIQLRRSNGQWSELFEIKSVLQGFEERTGTITPAGTQYYYYFTIELTQPLPAGYNASSSIANGFRLLKRKAVLPIVFDEDSKIASSPNPAIFETEPKESIDLEFYYEASNVQPIANLSNTITLPYFNCYSFGNGVESNRIRDDYNAKTMSKGVKVSSIVLEGYKQERRDTGLIYSGIYNSISGVNNLNQFIAGLGITKDLEPIYGGIQKLHARDTSLVAFCEDKIFRILADKDALYNADGNVNLVATNRVLGDAATFAGEYGISKNPESFASYGFRTYFTDKARGAVLRLSMDGLTIISDKNMSDFFQDGLKAQVRPLIGMYDEGADSYNISIDQEMISYKEKVDGWPTRLSYLPEMGVSLNNELYTFNGGEIWEHSNTTRSNFYGTQYDTEVTSIINDAPSSIKNFKALSYEGDAGWVADIITDKQTGEVTSWVDREGIQFNYISGTASTWNNATQSGTLDLREFSSQGIGVITAASPSGPGYELTFTGDINVSVQVGDIMFTVRANGDIEKIGAITSINRATGRIIVSDDYGVTPQPAGSEYAFAIKDNQKNTSGLLGYYAETTMSTSSGDKKELFGLNAEVFISSE